MAKHSPASHRLRRAGRNNKRLLGAMVLDQLDVELATTRLDVHNDVHGLGMSTGMSTDP